MNIDRQSESLGDRIYWQTLEKLSAGDVMEAVKEHLTGEEWDTLAEDLSSTPMRDLSHAGSILSDAVERYARHMATEAEIGEREFLNERGR
jgi:hypothetical protein